MCYHQDRVERICAVCGNPIEEFDWMIDLFRQQSSVEGSGQRVEWAHASCARTALERWLLKKRARESSQGSQ